MGEDDLTDIYRLEAAKSLETEAAKRIAEVADPVRDARLRATALKDLIESDDFDMDTAIEDSNDFFDKDDLEEHLEDMLDRGVISRTSNLLYYVPKDKKSKKE